MLGRPCLCLAQQTVRRKGSGVDNCSLPTLLFQHLWPLRFSSSGTAARAQAMRWPLLLRRGQGGDVP